MLKQRVLTVAVALPMFLAALFYFPNRWWGVLMAILILAGGNEWSRLAKFNPATHVVSLALLIAGCGILTVWPSHKAEQWFYCTSLMFWCAAVPCWLWFKWRAQAAALVIAGIIVLLPTWLALVRLQKDPMQLLAMLGVVWIADTAAFFTGRLYGKHKLAVQISPGKTWEGVAGAMVAVTLYAWLVSTTTLGLHNNIEMIIAIFLAMAVLSIVGDLFESWLKRVAEVKDSGNWLPGHGGVLDRIDGITAALPFIALLYAGGTLL
jgi:phosphatidate cytidylyltransferase